MKLTAKLVAAAAVLSGNVARADATPTGVEVGLRAGFAMPSGDLIPRSPLNIHVPGMVPIGVDAGYRFNPHVMVGAYFQYGIAFVSGGEQPGGSQPCSKLIEGGCSGSDLMFGAQLHYHFAPDRTIDPWAGIGVGYEILNIDASEPPGNSGSNSYTGFQFVNFQAGGDYEVMPSLGVGPFIMVSLGEYSGCSVTAITPGVQSPSCTIPITALHEWVTLGIRGTYDINL